MADMPCAKCVRAADAVISSIVALPVTFTSESAPSLTASTFNRRQPAKRAFPGLNHLKPHRKNEMTNTEKWPHWLPRGSSIRVEITDSQENYIKAVFNTCRKKPGSRVDGVSLMDGHLHGNRTSFLVFLRRFEFSGIDVSNILTQS